MIDYLIRLVEAILLQLRENNVDLQFADNNMVSIIGKDDAITNSNGLVRNLGDKNNNLNDTLEFHEAISSSAIDKILPQNNTTYMPNIEQLSDKDDKSGPNIISSIRAVAEDDMFKRNITYSRTNKIPSGYSSINNTKEMKEKTNDLKEKLEHIQKINSIPDDLASSGSVAIPVKYITGSSQPNYVTFETDEKENKRRRKGKREEWLEGRWKGRIARRWR